MRVMDWTFEAPRAVLTRAVARPLRVDAGVVTRRYHGLLVAALPAPHGRLVMLGHLTERVRQALDLTGTGLLREFRLEGGPPVWRYEAGGFVLEKSLVMPHQQNTVHVTYRLLEGPGAVRLVLAADQFIVVPGARVQDAARSRAAEAGSILRTFAYHIRDGLIPILFPESEGRDHTAAATLWFFHASAGMGAGGRSAARREDGLHAAVGCGSRRARPSPRSRRRPRDPAEQTAAPGPAPDAEPRSGLVRLVAVPG